MPVIDNLCGVPDWRVDSVHPELLIALYDFTLYDDFLIVLKHITYYASNLYTVNK